MSDPQAPVDQPGRSRRALIAAGLGALVLLTLVAVSWAVLGGGDGDESAADGTTTETESGSSDPDDAGATTTIDNLTDDPSTPGEPIGDPGPPVEPEWTLPTDAVVGASEVERCAAVLERLRVHRDLAQQSGTSALTLLFEATSELEAQVVTLAEAQDWGDRIVARLTDVRREWANARSAASAGDDDGANSAATRAIELLDETIATAACPE